MAFPLIPALVGAAAVAAVTYFITTKSSQKRITSAAREMGDSVQSGADKLKSVVSETADDASKAVKGAAADVKDAASKIID